MEWSKTLTEFLRGSRCHQWTDAGDVLMEFPTLTMQALHSITDQNHRFEWQTVTVNDVIVEQLRAGRSTRSVHRDHGRRGQQ